MKKILYPIIAIVFLLGSAFITLVLSDWKIKDNYSINFTSDHPSGKFKDLKGTIKFDENNLAASKFDVTIDISSIDTDNGLRDSHAQNSSWFDASKFPQIKYTSKEIVKTANGYQANGTLEIKGIKKDFSIPFTFSKSATEGEFKGIFEVNRTDFGIGSPGGKVPNVIKLDVTVPVTLK